MEKKNTGGETEMLVVDYYLKRCCSPWSERESEDSARERRGEGDGFTVVGASAESLRREWLIGRDICSER